MQQFFPARFTTAALSLDGVRVEVGIDPTLLSVTDKRGRQLDSLQPFEEQEIGVQRYLVRGWSDRAASEITALVEKTRGCGCGGPKRRTPSVEQLAELASWDDRELPV